MAGFFFLADNNTGAEEYGALGDVQRAIKGQCSAFCGKTGALFGFMDNNRPYSWKYGNLPTLNSESEL
jgi:hypothetical protein